jgi:hypothetical protein
MRFLVNGAVARVYVHERYLHWNGIDAYLVLGLAHMRWSYDWSIGQMPIVDTASKAGNVTDYLLCVSVEGAGHTVCWHMSPSSCTNHRFVNIA